MPMEDPFASSFPFRPQTTSSSPRPVLKVWSILLAGFLVVLAMPISHANARVTAHRTDQAVEQAGFDFHSGPYRLRFARNAGELVLAKRNSANGLAISEIAGSRTTNVLAHVGWIGVPPGSHTAILSGRTSWCTFTPDV